MLCGIPHFRGFWSSCGLWRESQSWGQAERQTSSGGSLHLCSLLKLTPIVQLECQGEATCMMSPNEPQIVVFLSLCNSVPWSLGCLLSSRTRRCHRMTLMPVLLALPLSPFWLTGFDEIRSHVAEVHMTRDLAWALASYRLNIGAPPPNSYLESLTPSVMVFEVGNN